jgi:NAD(P)-dependent dehydrogenase (short-subunit alcohol dehydrogenase family)
VRAAILGATKGMGRELARQMAARGDDVFLLGRDEAELARSVAERRPRSGGEAARFGHSACDLERPEGFAAALDAAEAGLGGLDAVVVTAGLFASQEALEADVELARRVATVNYANTLVFCEHARRRLLARGGGRLVVFSSVAGERGRKPVVIYGSGKAGLSAYLEGLDHRFHAQGLRVVCVKPGFVKTSMTAGLKPPPFAGEPAQVARQVLARLDRPRPVVYTPRMWALVMFVIRLLPRFVMRRISF